MRFVCSSAPRDRRLNTNELRRWSVWLPLRCRVLILWPPCLTGAKVEVILHWLIYMAYIFINGKSMPCRFRITVYRMDTVSRLIWIEFVLVRSYNLDHKKLSPALRQHFGLVSLQTRIYTDCIYLCPFLQGFLEQREVLFLCLMQTSYWLANQSYTLSEWVYWILSFAKVITANRLLSSH